AVLIAESELVTVAVQVAPANVMERAVDTALEQAKEAFRRVAVNVAAHELITRVVHAVVLASGLFCHQSIGGKFIRHQSSMRMHVRRDRGLEIFRSDAGHSERLHST